MATNLDKEVETIVNSLNELQSAGYSPEEIKEFVEKYCYNHTIERLKKFPTKNMGDNVLIAISML